MNNIMKIYIIWLIGVILWNFSYPSATPLMDVLAAIILSFVSVGLKKYFKISSMKNKYFDNM